MRPTVRGWQALFFGVLALCAARIVGTTQFYQFAYALAGLFVVALVLGLVSASGLRYERRIPERERFVAGRRARVGLVVSNTARTRSPEVEVVDRLPEKHLVRTPPIEGRVTRALEETVVFPRRGVYAVGPAEISTTDPFGLLRFARRFEERREEVVVYPRIHDLPDLPPLTGRLTRQAGARGALARGGDEFADLREYRRGDDRRHIHWKSVARTGELMVREFAQDAPQRHAVVLDLHRPSSPAGAPEVEIEDAVSAAGSVLWRLADAGLPFRLICSDKGRAETAFGADEASRWRSLALLAGVKADGDRAVGAFLDEVLRGGGREAFGEGAVLVARGVDGDLVKTAERLRGAGLPVTVVALALHTYRGGGPSGHAAAEGAFSREVRRLELAGAAVLVVRRPGGVAALAEGAAGGGAGARETARGAGRR